MILINNYVSGCIVTHNNMKSIDETVSSLLRCTTGIDFKLYVIDNFSTDSTADHVLKTYPQVKVIEPKTNNGFGSGHNLMLPLLDSKYHCVINPDISITEDVITKMAKYMDEHPEIGLLSPKICFPDGRPQILGKRNPKLRYLVASRLRDESDPGKALREYAMLDGDLTKPCDIENATGCFMMFRTDIFKEIGGFDERYFMYFEDSDITRTIRKQARAVYYPDATVYHVWGRDSKKNLKHMMIHVSSMFKYFSKWNFNRG